MPNSHLVQAIDLFTSQLQLPDASPLLVGLGAIVGNQTDGDPVWLLLIGPPSSAKTEALRPYEGLSFVFPTATITEAGLLSGSPTRDQADDATGGLLREIGEFGIIALKDFGSVLSMGREKRAAVLAALREIYDGSWVRRLGTDGGRSFAWQGKVGLLGACTEQIERHHGVMSAMGERFIILRMPPVCPEPQAEQALSHGSGFETFRERLQEAAAAVVNNASSEVDELPPEEKTGLANLASLIASARSSVDREGTNREVALVPQSEGPARIAKTLKQLRSGLVAIGLPIPIANQLVTKVAFDCLPSTRLAVLRPLMGGESGSAKDLARPTPYSETLTRRQLEELEAHGVVARQRSGGGDEWTISERTRDRLTAARKFSENVMTLGEPVLPETSALLGMLSGPSAEDASDGE